MIPLDYLERIMALQQQYGVTHVEIEGVKLHMPGAGQPQAPQKSEPEKTTPLDLEPVRVNAAGEIEVNPALFGLGG
jgi:hypothetical protein